MKIILIIIEFYLVVIRNYECTFFFLKKNQFSKLIYLKINFFKLKIY